LNRRIAESPNPESRIDRRTNMKKRLTDYASCAG
jgi:hypothetical protein